MNTTQKINWGEIFDGQEHLLIEGVHYKRTFSFTKYIYQKAREYNIKVRQKVSSDNKSILVQRKINEIVVSERKVIDGEIVNDCELDIVRPRFNETGSKYPFEEWFAELVCGGQKEVETNVLDEFSNPIPIMKEFEGGFKVPSGHYETEKKIVTFKPKLFIKLKYPQDFTCSVNKIIGIFSDAAKAVGIDVNKLHFDGKRFKQTRTLIIRAGKLAESYIDLEENPDKYDIWTTFTEKRRKLPREEAEKWIDILVKEGRIELRKGKHYAGSGFLLAALLREHFPDIDFYPKEFKDGELGDVMLVLTLRKPLAGRLNPDLTLEEWENMPEGKLVEQPRDIQRLALEDKKLLEDKGYARLKYVEEAKRLTLDIGRTKLDRLKRRFEDELISLREDYIVLLGHEEVDLLDNKLKLLENKPVIEEKKDE